MKRKALSFSSGKWIDKARALLPLAAGILLCGIALTAASRRISAVENEIRKEAKPVEVVVASVPISAGETFSERNLAKKAVPSSGTGKRNVPASEFELLLGARAKTPVEPGEPVLWTDVEEPYDTDSLSRMVLPGRRALTLGVDATSSFAGMLHPGDRVDLLVQGGDGGGSDWVRGVPVIAVDRHRNPLANAAAESDSATVTIMVTPWEGARITRASGKLLWFLRNPDDNTAAEAPAQGKSYPSAVEIWHAGIKVRTSAASRGIPE